jgi:hypothetical protein
VTYNHRSIGIKRRPIQHSCKKHIKQGKLQCALSLLHASDEEHPFEQWFVTWVRAAFQAKKCFGDS